MLKLILRWFLSFFRATPELPANSSGDAWALSRRLFRLSKRDDFTLGRAVEGILVFGATGSGKTSGSGRAIALSFLRSGMGGVVLVAKSEETRLWQQYAKEAGRSDDLIIFGPDQLWRFNFLDFEVQRKGRGAGLTQNLVILLITIAGITKRNAANGGGQDEGAYWEDSKHELLRNLIDLIILAKGSITVGDLYDVLSSAPTSLEQTRSAEWKRDSLCSHYLIEAYKRPKTPEQQKDFEIVADFWLHAWAGLAEKTRSIVASTFRSMVDVINRGVLRTLFCGETNLTPQAVEDGKIIVIDLPVKEFGDVGQYAAAIFKYAFQMSISRRDTQVSPRPVFIFQDEAQHFVLSTDSMFQSTCRSYKVSTVLLTQNISGFYAAMGHGSEPLVDSLFANLNTKIFHANGDQATNKWAAEAIGRVRVLMANSSTTRQEVGGFSDALGIGNVQTSAGISEIYEFEIQPSFFVAGLKTGGPDNRCLVEAIVFRSGVCFRATGRPYLFCTFSQK